MPDVWETEDKWNYIDEHLNYEVEQVAELAACLADGRRGQIGGTAGVSARVIGSAMLNSLLLAVRCLNEFLGNAKMDDTGALSKDPKTGDVIVRSRGKPNPADMLPHDFAPKWAHARPLDRDTAERINREIAHLTYNRKWEPTDKSWTAEPAETVLICARDFYTAMKKPFPKIAQDFLARRVPLRNPANIARLRNQKIAPSEPSAFTSVRGQGLMYVRDQLEPVAATVTTNIPASSSDPFMPET